MSREPGLSGADIDDSMREKHFVTLARLVETHTGIQLPMNKRVMLEGRLRRRVRALGLANLTEYGNAIFEDGRLEEEFDHVVDGATTNKTDFFREPAHFAFLREHAIPIALQQRSGRDSLKFWSAAASNGAEAYTIAMVAAETLGLGSRAFSVLGTDISRGVIAEARRAIYPSSFVDPVPRALRDRYLMAARDARRREVRVVPAEAVGPLRAPQPYGCAIHRRQRLRRHLLPQRSDILHQGDPGRRHATAGARLRTGGHLIWDTLNPGPATAGRSCARWRTAFRRVA